MFRTLSPRLHGLSPLALLVAVCALQFGAFYAGAGTSTPRESHVATSAPLPPSAPTSDTVGLEGVDGDAGTGEPRSVAPRAPTVRSESVSAVAAAFCPWLTPDALARAGRTNFPATAPPVSRV